MSFLLAGLGSTYDSFVMFVTTRVDPISLKDLYSHMFALDFSLVDFNMASRTRGGRSGRGGCDANFDFSRSNCEEEVVAVLQMLICPSRFVKFAITPITPEFVTIIDSINVRELSLLWVGKLGFFATDMGS